MTDAQTNQTTSQSEVTPSTEGVPPTESTMAVDDLPVIRRRSRTIFAARSADPKDADVVVSRGILSARSAKKPETSRHRKVAGNLPAWEPLPPGEIVVRRSSSG